MSPDMHYRRALAYLQNDQPVRAKGELTNEMMQRTADPNHSFLLGKVYFLLGDYQNARKQLRNALELGYNQPDLFKILAETYLKLNYRSQALATADRLLLLDDNADNKTIRGQVMLAIGDTTEAVDYFLQSMRQDSTIKQNFMALNTVWRAQGKEQQAVALIDRYLRLHPEDRVIQEEKADGLLEAGHTAESRTIYEQLLADDPKNSDLLLQHARTYFMEHRYDSAMIQARRALVSNENNMDARILLAQTLENQRLFEEARESYGSILAMDSTVKAAVDGMDRLDRRAAYLRYLQQQKQRQLDSQQNNSETEKTGSDDNGLIPGK